MQIQNFLSGIQDLLQTSLENVMNSNFVFWLNRHHFQYCVSILISTSDDSVLAVSVSSIGKRQAEIQALPTHRILRRKKRNRQALRALRAHWEGEGKGEKEPARAASTPSTLGGGKRRKRQSSPCIRYFAKETWEPINQPHIAILEEKETLSRLNDCFNR